MKYLLLLIQFLIVTSTVAQRMVIDSVNGADEAAILIIHAASEGIQVNSSVRDGFQVLSAGFSGLYIADARFDGVNIGMVGSSGIQVDSAGNEGVYIRRAGNYGVLIENTGDDGVNIGSAGDDGVHVGFASSHGVHVANAGLSGVYGNSDTGTGIEGYSDTGTGVYGFSESGIGGSFSSLEVNGMATIEGSATIGIPGNGNTLLTLNSERSWVFRQRGTGPTTALELAVANSANANKNFVINTTAHVGIGDITPTEPLHMESGAHVTDGGVWTNSSSRSLKENIYDLTVEEATSTMEALNPVKFNYLRQKDEEYLGFIAEDVPALVATQDRKSLSPMDIVAVLTKVVQDQQLKINDLSEQVSELHMLKNEVAELKQFLRPHVD